MRYVPFLEVGNGRFITNFNFLFLFSGLLVFQTCVFTSFLISAAVVPVFVLSFFYVHCTYDSSKEGTRCRQTQVVYKNV